VVILGGFCAIGPFLGIFALGGGFVFLPDVDAAAVMSQTTTITASGIHPPSASKMENAGRFN